MGKGSTDVPEYTNTVFVGRLNSDVDDQALHEYFETAGEIIEARVFTDKSTGNSKGSGMVVFKTEDGFRTALDNFDNTHLNGRSILVRDFNTPPEERNGSSSVGNGESGYKDGARPGAGNKGAKDGGKGKGKTGKGDTVNTIFVGRMPLHVEAEQLKQYFEEAGEIIDAVVFKDRNTGNSRGSGKVTFKTEEGLRRAIEEWD